jgi:Holliday junction resolvasome RuvABC endonuclease subunit
MEEENPIVLSLFPNRRGLGYVCLDVVERKILESGVANVRPISNERVIARIKRFIEFHTPTIIIVRDPKERTIKGTIRLSELNTLIDNCAKTKHTPVYRYTRRQIREVFELFGANNKDEIAKQIIEWFDELAPLAPKIRKPWMDEDYHMGVFDAMSLAITHQYLTK